MISGVLYVLYMSDLVPLGLPILNDVPTILKCGLLAMNSNSNSFFYNKNSKSCIINNLEPFHSTEGLKTSVGFNYYLANAPKCGLPPSFENSTLNSVTELNGTFTAEYTCDVDNNYKYSTSVCTESSWSTNITCYAPTKCSDVKLCNPSYRTDGEYWLYPSILNHQKARFYCNDMDTSNPTEYITLYGTNIVEYPNYAYLANTGCLLNTYSFPFESGKTEFLKIRIHIENMTVKADDYAFINQLENFYLRPYGRAEACSVYDTTICPQRGKATLNLSYTGFKFSPTNNWKGDGWQPHMTIVTRTDHEVVLTGDGGCGGAYPDGPIKLELDLSNMPESVSATRVICIPSN